MPNTYHRDGIFNSRLITMRDSYIVRLIYLGNNCIQTFHLGTSVLWSVLWSEISFYGDAEAEP